MTESAVNYAHNNQMLSARTIYRVAKVLRSVLHARMRPVLDPMNPTMALLTSHERMVFLTLEEESGLVKVRLGADLATGPLPMRLSRQAITYFWGRSDVEDQNPVEWVKIRNWNPRDEMVFRVTDIIAQEGEALTLPALLKFSDFAKWCSEWIEWRLRPTQSTPTDARGALLSRCPHHCRVVSLGGRALRVEVIPSPPDSDLVEHGGN